MEHGCDSCAAEVMESMTPVTIYALCDPRTDEVRYVGKTINLAKRMCGHLDKTALKPRTLKNGWIKSLLKINLTPLPIVLEVTWHYEWEASERRWIAHYKSIGARLTNGTDGGDGGAISRLRGIPRSIEVKAKISAAHIGMKLTDGAKAKISAALIGRKRSPEVCAQLSVSHTKRWSKLDATTRSKIVTPSALLRRKPVEQVDLNGNIVAEYSHAREASAKTGVTWKNISRVCNGNRKTGGGFVWRFKDQDGDLA